MWLDGERRLRGNVGGSQRKSMPASQIYARIDILCKTDTTLVT